MGALVCSAVHSICDVCEMIVDIDLRPGAESIDKDRYTYPTVAPNFLPFASLRETWESNPGTPPADC